mmetsp:Transcript_596/g.1729  ORF Transcript_596/g.1729 Transcript_596/m.1729 type:complete len:228 (-) Transcript_596:649-1332(-)
MQRLERAQALEGRAALEREDGHEGEDGVLPVLVEQPQDGAKELEHCERRHELLAVHGQERRRRDGEDVLAEALRALRDRRRVQPAGLHVRAHGLGDGAPRSAHGAVGSALADQRLVVRRVRDGRVRVALAVAAHRERRRLGGGQQLVRLALEGEDEPADDVGAPNGAERRLAAVALRHDVQDAAGLDRRGGRVQRRGLEPHEPAAEQVEERVQRAGAEDGGTRPRVR